MKKSNTSSSNKIAPYIKNQLQYFIILSLLFFSIPAFGQINLDSLSQIWLDKSNPDTLRANSYLDYIYNYYVLQEPDSADLHFQLLYDFCIEKNISKQAIQTKRVEGYHYFRVGEYSTAIESYDKGLALAQESNDTSEIAEIILRKGWLYHDTGQKPKAIANYIKCLNYFEALNKYSGILSVYNELGSIYRDEEDWEKSLNYYQRSLEAGKKIGFKNKAVIANLGDLYIEMEQYDTALVYLYKSQKFAKAENDKLVIGSNMTSIGYVHKMKGNNEIAVEYLKEALAISQEINDVQRIVACLLILADIDLENNRNKSAINRCKTCLIKAKEIGDLDDIYDTYDCLYRASKAMGNGDLALEYFENMQLYEDSLKLRETTLQLIEMEFETKIKTDSLEQVQKDLQTEKLHQEEIASTEKNKNIIIFCGLIFLVAALGLFFRNRIMNSSQLKLQKEKDRSESLLLNILPPAIAEELKSKGKIEPRNFEDVSILFTDFKSFTKKSESVSPKILVAEINDCFAAFDHICGKYKIEKIKTIGDAYMAAGGLLITSKNAIKNTVLAGLEMQDFIINRKQENRGHIPFEMRLGIHTGPVTAGVVGVKKFQYDLWGDTVNTASRMESAGEINQVNLSETTYSLIKDDPEFSFDIRDEQEIKGKGMMKMYFVKLK